MEDYIGEISDREKIWTQAIAAGSVKFIEDIKAKLGLKAKHIRIRRNGNGQNAVYALQETIAAYSADFEGKKEVLRTKNRLLWDLFSDI